MFNSISWQEYFTWVITFLIIYYGYIVIMYFRHDVKISRQVPAQASSAGTKTLFKEEEEHALLFSAVHELMQELRETFERAALNQFKKEGLLMGLQSNLVKYKKLKGTPFQVSVNNHIIKESNLLSIQVDENDLKNMW